MRGESERRRFYFFISGMKRSEGQVFLNSEVQSGKTIYIFLIMVLIFIYLFNI